MSLKTMSQYTSDPGSLSSADRRGPAPRLFMGALLWPWMCTYCCQWPEGPQNSPCGKVNVVSVTTCTFHAGGYLSRLLRRPGPNFQQGRTAARMGRSRQMQDFVGRNTQPRMCGGQREEWQLARETFAHYGVIRQVTALDTWAGKF